MACPHRRQPGKTAPIKSRDNIRDQVVPDHRDLVLEPQFAFFEAGDLELVGGARAGQCVDCGVKIAVLGPEHFEALFHFLFVHALVTSCCLLIAAQLIATQLIATQLIATWNRLTA